MEFQSCSQNNYDSCLEQFPLAMAYVPFQRFGRPYDLPKGFQCGTIFPELNKPFLGSGGCKSWRK